MKHQWNILLTPLYKLICHSLHFTPYGSLLSWHATLNCVTLDITIFTCHSWPVGLYMLQLTSHSWSVNLYMSLLKYYSWHVTLDLLLLTWQSWQDTVDILFQHVTLNMSPLICHSRHVTLDMSLFTYHSWSHWHFILNYSLLKYH